jgi:hypothetical protein
VIKKPKGGRYLKDHTEYVGLERKKRKVSAVALEME